MNKMSQAASLCFNVNKKRRQRRKRMTASEKGGKPLDSVESEKKKDGLSADNTFYHEVNDNEIEYEMKESLEDKQEKQKCVKCRACCFNCCRPCMTSENPLSDDPSCCSRFKFAFMCPPHGRLGALILCIFLFGLWYGVTFFMTGDQMLPGGNLFALSILFIACWCGGYLFTLINLPSLLGMLIVGGILGNAPYINVARDINTHWSIGARQIALAVILIRAGLGLDPKALKKLSFVVIRLAFSPCLMETITDGLVAHFLLGLPWEFSLMLGFVLAAVSPAVVVPSLLNLSDRGYGVDKGIPTLVMAAASVDDVLAITGFGVLMGMAFSSGNLVWTLFKGPLEALIGICYGIIGGMVLWYIPQKSSKNLSLLRCSLLMAGGLFVLFGSRSAGYAGAGPLGCLTMPFVAAFKWRHDRVPGVNDPVESAIGVLWMIFQPLLFGLIGAQVKIEEIDVHTVGLGVATLFIGLAVRMAVSFLAVQRTDLNLKERLFIPFAWLPKATVQAAIGGVALDTATHLQDEQRMVYGEDILTLAVLSILITAPIGSFLMAVLGPRLLSKSESDDSKVEDGVVDGVAAMEKEDSSRSNDALNIDDEVKFTPQPENGESTTRM